MSAGNGTVPTADQVAALNRLYASAWMIYDEQVKLEARAAVARCVASANMHAAHEAYASARNALKASTV
jgi:hypothetical protein